MEGRATKGPSSEGSGRCESDRERNLRVELKETDKGRAETEPARVPPGQHHKDRHRHDKRSKRREAEQKRSKQRTKQMHTDAKSKEQKLRRKKNYQKPLSAK